jgi:glycerophosphoryl diester phosphodiesterase
MIIISHRGYWSKNEDKNTLQSFNNTYSKSFGTETDIRDNNNQLVISHDVANNQSLKLDTVLELFKDNNLLLALNIKSDGLQNLLRFSLNKYKISNYFVFDMSIPDTILYLNMGFKVFCRQSEYEEITPFYDKLIGVWLDSFENIWYTPDLVKDHLSKGKQVCIVSAELHKRNHLEHWSFLKSWNFINDNNIILCTDFPEEANNYFNNN